MGYELRRALRNVLGSEITGLQRAVALEIADDAKAETRESWASLEDLARWTGAKDVNVVRNALKRLAAMGWEFRVPLGVGKDGRVLYAVPGKRLTFRVPAFQGVAPATPKEEPPLPLETKGVAPAPSERAPAPSEGAPATPFSSSPHPLISLSPPAPIDSPKPPAAPKAEREISPTPPTAANATTAVAAAWTVARGGRRNPAAERNIHSSANELLAAGWNQADLIALAEDMARRQPTFTNLGKHAPFWQPQRPATPTSIRADPTFCGENGCDYGQIEQPDGRFAPCPCTRKATAA